MPSMKDKGNYLEITTATSRVIFTKQCKLTRTINDLLVGIFFVFGSLLNILDFGAFYGSLLYLLGSLILAGRAVHSIRENISVDHEMKNKELDESTY